MKAEHRKELHTNLLADRLGKVVESVKSGPSSNSLMIWIGLAVLVVIVIGWRIYTSKAADDRSAQWVRLDAAFQDEKEARAKLTELAKNSRSQAGRVARLQLARREFQEGVRNLPAPLAREEAIKSLESARKQFTELASDVASDPLLGPEALMGQARAEEVLAGVPKDNNPKEGRGDLKTAMAVFQAVIKKFPDSAEAKTAKERLKHFENEQEFEALKLFYTRLREEYTKAPPLPDPVK